MRRLCGESWSATCAEHFCLFTEKYLMSSKSLSPASTAAPRADTAEAPAPASKLAVLHRETHRHLRLNRRTPDYRFASGAVTVALMAAELPAACTEFPCVFARQPDGDLSLLAVTGLQTGHNLYVAPDGSWLGNHLPATLATWPFRLVREGGAPGSYLVAVNPAELSEATGDPLFDASGAEVPWLLERLRLLVDTDTGLTDTARQIAALDAAGVLCERSLQAVLADGRDVELNGFMVVDEAKLLALPEKAVHELHTQGVLSLAYLQLLSMRRFRPLVVRAGQQVLRGESDSTGSAHAAGEAP